MMRSIDEGENSSTREVTLSLALSRRGRGE